MLFLLSRDWRKVQNHWTTRTLLFLSQRVLVDYLISLRDNGTKAWQLLQAARAIEMYAGVVVRTFDVNFKFITDKPLRASARVPAYLM